jgi:hypothetical protein
MSKVYILVIGNRQNRTLSPLAGSINNRLHDHGFTKVSCEHVYSRHAGPFGYREEDKFVLSEHYLAVPLRYGPDAVKDVVITGDADMVVQPPITMVNYQGVTGVAVVGHINSGKSYLIHIINEMLRHSNLVRGEIIEDRLPGTFGFQGLSPDCVARLHKELDIEIRVIECPNRARFGEFLQISN